MSRRTTLLLPRPGQAAIEERFAMMQTNGLFRRLVPHANTLDYDPSCDPLPELPDTDDVLVVTDPMLLPSLSIYEELAAALNDDAEASIPVTNDPTNTVQYSPPAEPYFTLREFEALPRPTASPALHVWTDGDPGLFLTRPSLLREHRGAIWSSLAGRRVALVPRAFCHRFPKVHHSNLRTDLLDRTPTDARSILELGCGEGRLGAAVKSRQPCRYVGIDIHEASAREARSVLDLAIAGDAAEVIDQLDESFDFIVGGDVIEHLADPWTFLRRLRRLSRRGTRLLLSIPNIGNASIVADLLKGRFDYVYMGALSAGHLRHFTRKTIEDLFLISGWTTTRIETMPAPPSRHGEQLIDSLVLADPARREDLLAIAFYASAVLEG